MEDTNSNGSGGQKVEEPCGCLEILAPQRIITLRTSGQEYLVHENILTRSSHYFRKCLLNRSQFVEARTGIIAFDDVDPVSLRHYINFAYHQSFFSGPGIPKSHRQPGGCVANLARVYRLCDRFLDAALQRDVGNTLVFVLDYRTPSPPPPGQKAPDLGMWIADYAEGYEMLDSGDSGQQLLRERLLGSFCKHFPLSQFREHSEAVAHHHQFSFELSRRFADMLHVQANTIQRLNRKR
ncbi:Putative BTB/POZ domain-containing protein [Colletotrichum destructivum]|uniref:BTB/POZ domain-containing protein n=1 Tax=Colletotrichum destructivum TaxID=34406 RepID=A0AAX4IP40_9PEZI|nr:Putative BTB/POZ domain-containing protein [Colletotrichum destructivum]